MEENLTEPIISVIMPAYNAENYIAEAIQSILNQTFKNFEFIIINDGSTDKTESIIKKFDDSRIIYVKNDLNKNIVESLNFGIELARGLYIARMDADDISMPNRLETQLFFIEKNNFDIVGTWVNNFSTPYVHSILKLPEKSSDIFFFTLLFSPLIHSSILGRSILFKEYKYCKDFEYVEDLELWIRCILNDKLIGNVPEVLLKYRISEGQITQRKNLIQKKLSNKIRGIYFSSKFHNSNVDFEKYLNKLGPTISILELNKGLNEIIKIGIQNKVDNYWIRLVITELLRRSVFNFQHLSNALQISSLTKKDKILILKSFLVNNLKLVYKTVING
jgi:glycosyltransferase involved in cell wall biosynthesis